MATVARPVIKRKALFEMLSSRSSRGVTLVSAPPGSGKSTLLRLWIEEAGLRKHAAWVSVERAEQDPQRLWLALLAQLRKIPATNGLIENLEPTPDFEGEMVVERLATSLSALQERVILVIDDLHDLRSAEGQRQLEFFLTRRPSLVHVVLVTRHDPQLRLHQLRLSGELTEIRAVDLKFSFDETRELLAVFGITLSHESVAMLYSRTEGWVAGLRLAAISLANRSDPERFIAEFSGSERTVAEYLLAEVLERQPDDVRQLLLRTSILDRVNGELANLLVGRSGCERVLQELEHANAFITSLDASRSWFRYHQMFADFLRLELRRTEPDCVVKLHQAAAQWYLNHGYNVEAIRHMQEAQDWTRAARLLADQYFGLWLNGQNETARSLLAAFPPSVSEPEVAVVSALVHFAHGPLDESATYIAVAERQIAQLPDERRLRLDAALALARLTLARRRGDFGSVLKDVKSLAPATNPNTLDDIAFSNDLRALALMNLGIVEKSLFRFEEGEQHLQQGAELARRIGRPYVEIGCLSYQGIEQQADMLHTVSREQCAQAIANAQAHGWESDPIVTAALVRMAQWAGREGRFDEAWRWVNRADKSLRPDVDPWMGLQFYLAQGGLNFISGRPERALRSLRAAQKLQNSLLTQNLFSVSVTRLLVQTQLRLGDVSGARATLDAIGGDVRDWGDIRIALAALHLAEGNVLAAIDALAPIIDGSAPRIYTFTKQHAFLLDAKARDALSETRVAHDDIERALEIARAESSIIPLMISSSPDRIERHLQEGSAYATLALQILDQMSGAPSLNCAYEPLALKDRLTEGELRVLRYLATNLTAPEIGAELRLSSNTVKTHMREIYAKVGAHSRSQAVDRARKLGLLAPSLRR